MLALPIVSGATNLAHAASPEPQVPGPRTLRVAHIGNIANNAYSNAKFQRRRGLPADMYHYRFEFVMGHPEWEDADFDIVVEPFDPPDWSTVRFTNGYQRPAWARYLSALPPDEDPAQPNASVRLEHVLAATAPGGLAGTLAGSDSSGTSGGRLAVFLRQLLEWSARRYAWLNRQGQLTPSERLQLLALSLVREAVVWLACERVERGMLLGERQRMIRAGLADLNEHSRLLETGLHLRMRELAPYTFWYSFRATCRPYDLVQLYGLEAAKGMFLPPEQSFVALEHSTMREIPFEQSLRGRLLSLAYKAADWCIITNPDVVDSAKRLQLERYTFIPHPLDETKYVDCPTPLRDRLRRELSCQLVLFCPTRHEWSDDFDSKRTDRVLRAFARYVREGEPAGLPRAALVLCEWGRDVRASKRLLAELRLVDRVAWRPPMHKLRLLEYYRASDVVLDQFHDRVGTFGTVTAEAMSCSRPVIMYFNPEVHHWCWPELPPIVSARTEDEVFVRLGELAGDPRHRQRVGAASRAWIERWHGWQRTADLHLDLYRDVTACRGLPVAVLPS